jgi:hypothetical protein
MLLCSHLIRELLYVHVIVPSTWAPLGARLSARCHFTGPKKLSISRAQPHGRMNYKDTKPYMSAFLSVDLLTDFAAFCLTDFIDWRYIHSWFVFSSQLVNCCPQGRRNHTLLYLCTVAPLLYLLSDPFPIPPYQCTVYTDSV